MTARPKKRRPHLYIASDGREWKIRFRRVVRLSGQTVDGLCDHEAREIYIATAADPRRGETIPPSESGIAGSLLHELLHVIDDNAEEHEIEKLEQALSASMRRNKQAWAWILGNL